MCEGPSHVRHAVPSLALLLLSSAPAAALGVADEHTVVAEGVSQQQIGRFTYLQVTAEIFNDGCGA